MKETEIHALMCIINILRNHPSELRLFAGELGDLDNIMYELRKIEDNNKKINKLMQEERELES